MRVVCIKLLWATNSWPRKLCKVNSLERSLRSRQTLGSDLCVDEYPAGRTRLEDWPTNAKAQESQTNQQPDFPWPTRHRPEHDGLLDPLKSKSMDPLVESPPNTRTSLPKSRTNWQWELPTGKPSQRKCMKEDMVDNSSCFPSRPFTAREMRTEREEWQLVAHYEHKHTLLPAPSDPPTILGMFCSDSPPLELRFCQRLGTIHPKRTKGAQPPWHFIPTYKYF